MNIIKATVHGIMSLYIAFLNLIFDSGVLSNACLEGIIRDICKKMTTEKEYYRHITILSCFRKLITSILDPHLNEFIDAHTVSEEYDSGFHAGYSTMGHIFILHGLTKTRKKIVPFNY